MKSTQLTFDINLTIAKVIFGRLLHSYDLMIKILAAHHHTTEKTRPNPLGDYFVYVNHILPTPNRTYTEIIESNG